jgi:negative regulator of flagellin synthesis FlgM
MQIHGVSHLHGAQSIHGPHRTSAASSTSPTDSWVGVDELDISQEADLVSRVHDLPEIRADRVQHIRSEIDAGGYDTQDKLEIAVGRLLDELSG